MYITGNSLFGNKREIRVRRTYQKRIKNQRERERGGGGERTMSIIDETREILSEKQETIRSYLEKRERTYLWGRQTSHTSISEKISRPKSHI